MKAQRSLIWYVYPPFLLIVIISLVAMNIYAGNTFRNLYINQLIDDLELAAKLTSVQLQTTREGLHPIKYDSLIAAVADFEDKHISIISSDGRVLASSSQNELGKLNQLDQPEVQLALAGSVGHAERYHASLKEHMLYVATPVKIGSSVPLIVRMGVPLTTVDTALANIYTNILLTGCLVALLAGIVSLFLANRVNRQIQDIQQGAERFAEGHLQFRLQVPQSRELSRLVSAMNTMARQLDERIKTIIAHRNQLDAVLSSMSEAVVAFDLDEKILFLNSAAENLFDLQQFSASGQSIASVIRNSQFQGFVKELLSSRSSLSGDIMAGSKREFLLEVHGNVLLDEGGSVIGGLVVLNDISELRRLENIRKDFVANVSHELRTPITSIKGFVETLLAENTSDQESSKRFLEIVQKHADRLGQIIEDLLSLSRIEQQSNSEQIETEYTKISQIIDSSINLCEQSATHKNILIERSCREELRGQVAPSLLEQALVNLIDNAIKYSDDYSSIRVEATESKNEIVISVHDNGCGIPKEHLPRLFERFYRVDKARSRKVGGTGLGLSIVKHIAQAMNGYPSVSSVVGKGSTFSIHLPRSVPKP